MSINKKLSGIATVLYTHYSDDVSISMEDETIIVDINEDSKNVENSILKRLSYIDDEDDFNVFYNIMESGLKIKITKNKESIEDWRSVNK